MMHRGVQRGARRTRPRGLGGSDGRRGKENVRWLDVYGRRTDVLRCAQERPGRPHRAGRVRRPCCTTARPTIRLQRAADAGHGSTSRTAPLRMRGSCVHGCSAGSTTWRHTLRRPNGANAVSRAQVQPGVAAECDDREPLEYGRHPRACCSRERSVGIQVRASAAIPCRTIERAKRVVTVAGTSR